MSFLVAVRILPAGGGVLPAGSGVLPAGGCLPAGGVSAASIFAAGAQTGAQTRLLSAAAVSRLNRSCRVRLIDAITLIINYLDTPLGCPFTYLYIG